MANEQGSTIGKETNWTLQQEAKDGVKTIKVDIDGDEYELPDPEHPETWAHKGVDWYESFLKRQLDRYSGPVIMWAICHEILNRMLGVQKGDNLYAKAARIVERHFEETRSETDLEKLKTRSATILEELYTMSKSAEEMTRIATQCIVKLPLKQLRELIYVKDLSGEILQTELVRLLNEVDK